MARRKFGGDPKFRWAWAYADDPEEVFLLEWGKLMTYERAMRSFREMPRRTGVRMVLCQMECKLTVRAER